MQRKPRYLGEMPRKIMFRSGFLRMALVLSLVTGCAAAGILKPPIESPPTLSAPLQLSSASAVQAVVSDCARMCAKRFECSNVPQKACEAGCDQIFNIGKLYPLCGLAAAKGLQCFNQLDCPGWSAFNKGVTLGRDDMPCVKEDLDDYLYCSGTPEAMSCVNSCAVKVACESVSENTDECARKCVRDLYLQKLQFGPRCWNALVMVNICKQSLSCAQWRVFNMTSASRPCVSEANAVSDLCRP